MAFCNSCGAVLEPSAKFCNKCGGAAGTAAGSAAPAASAAAPGTAAPAKSSSGLKIVLIVLAVIVGFVILAVVGMGVVGWQIAKHSRVQQNGANSRVETPFGTVETTDNPNEALQNLGIDVYPGAQPLKGASVASFAGMHTVTAPFESDDSPDKVADFYKAKFPNANVSTVSNDRYTIMSTDKKAVTTINIQPEGGRTKFIITNVTKP